MSKEITMIFNKAQTTKSSTLAFVRAAVQLPAQFSELLTFY